MGVNDQVMALLTLAQLKSVFNQLDYSSLALLIGKPFRRAV
jgi:hypothetical protein